MEVIVMFVKTVNNLGLTIGWFIILQSSYALDLQVLLDEPATYKPNATEVRKKTKLAQQAREERLKREKQAEFHRKRQKRLQQERLAEQKKIEQARKSKDYTLEDTVILMEFFKDNYHSPLNLSLANRLEFYLKQKNTDIITANHFYQEELSFLKKLEKGIQEHYKILLGKSNTVDELDYLIERIHLEYTCHELNVKMLHNSTSSLKQYFTKLRYAVSACPDF